MAEVTPPYSDRPPRAAPAGRGVVEPSDRWWLHRMLCGRWMAHVHDDHLNGFANAHNIDLQHSMAVSRHYWVEAAAARHADVTCTVTVTDYGRTREDAIAAAEKKWASLWRWAERKAIDNWHERRDHIDETHRFTPKTPDGMRIAPPGT